MKDSDAERQELSDHLAAATGTGSSIGDDKNDPDVESVRPIPRTRRAPTQIPLSGSASSKSAIRKSDWPSPSLDVIKKAKLGNPAARTLVVQQSLYLPERYARKMLRSGRHIRISYEDLVQEGSIGLLVAIDKFDARFGTPFSAYAWIWVKKLIRKAVREGRGIITTPEDTPDVTDEAETGGDLQQIGEQNQLHGETAEDALSIGRRRARAEAARRANIVLSFEEDKEQIDAALEDESVGNQPDFQAERNELASYASLILHNESILDEPARQMVIMKFGFSEAEPLTYSEIAQRYNMSTEGVRKKIIRSLTKLRSHFQSFH